MNTLTMFLIQMLEVCVMFSPHSLLLQMCIIFTFPVIKCFSPVNCCYFQHFSSRNSPTCEPLSLVVYLQKVRSLGVCVNGIPWVRHTYDVFVERDADWLTTGKLHRPLTISGHRPASSSTQRHKTKSTGSLLRWSDPTCVLVSVCLNERLHRQR